MFDYSKEVEVTNWIYIFDQELNLIESIDLGYYEDTGGLYIIDRELYIRLKGESADKEIFYKQYVLLDEYRIEES